jgi:hypothetical protein
MNKKDLISIFTHTVLPVRPRDDGTAWTDEDEKALSDAFKNGDTWARALHILGIADNPVKRPLAVKLWNRWNSGGPCYYEDPAFTKAFEAT